MTLETFQRFFEDLEEKTITKLTATISIPANIFLEHFKEELKYVKDVDEKIPNNIEILENGEIVNYKIEIIVTVEIQITNQELENYLDKDILDLQKKKF